jgi:hypothetical protein
MYHVVAYKSTGNTGVDVDAIPVPDNLMLIQNGHFLPQSDARLLFAYSGGLTQNYARIVTPTFRQITSPHIRPLDNAATPGNLPGYARYDRNPLVLKGLEEISVVTNNAGVVVGFQVLGLSLTPIMPAPQGNTFTLRGTGTTAQGVGAWSTIAVTWSDFLPSGTYVCIGLTAIAATCIAARLTFEGQWERPGCLGSGAVTNQEWPFFLKGNLGVLGNFHSYRMPSVEMLSVAADAAQTVFLELIKVG